MSHALGLRTRRSALAATLAVVTLFAALGAAPGAAAPARAAGPEMGMAQIAARTIPAVQLVRGTWKATIVVPGPLLDSDALGRLYRRMEKQLATGTVDPTKEAFTQAIVDAFVKDPLTYFVPGKDLRTLDAQVSGTGTGWVVTPDGYMVTAAHVVQPDDAELRDGFAQTALDEIANDAAQALAKSSAKNGNAFTDEQIVALAKAMTTYFAKYMKLTDVTSEITAQLGTAVAGGSKTQRPAAVEVVDVGEPYPGKDVALLKVDGGTNLPTVPIGDPTPLVAGDVLYVAGFPGASTFRSGFDKQSEAQPTVTSGPITALKTTTEGVPVFQTQAPASGGNSGGPVLDGRAQVVGVLVAGATENGVGLDGQEFAVTSTVVTEMLSKNGVTPKQSATTKTYDEALTAFYAGRYRTALPLFVQVRDQYPAHPYVGKFITDTQAAIADGKDVSPRPAWFWMLVGGGGVAALLAVVLLLVALRMRRPGRGSGAGPTAGGGTSGAGTGAGAAPQPVPAPQYVAAAQQGLPQGYPVPGAPHGYPQPAVPHGYPQPTAPQGYPQPTAPQGYPQPTAPQGYPQPAAPYGQPQQPGSAQPAPAWPGQGRPGQQTQPTQPTQPVNAAQPYDRPGPDGVPLPPPPGPGQGHPYRPQPPTR